MRVSAVIGAVTLVMACGYPEPARVSRDADPEAGSDGDVTDASPDAPGVMPDAAAPTDQVARCAMDDNPNDGTPACTGATASCTACPAALASGHIGGGYTFNAGSSHIVALSPNTLVAAHYTISIWIKPGASANFVTVFGAALSTTLDQSSVAILVAPGSYGEFETTKNGTPDYLAGGSNLRDGNWHHIAVTWDGTTKRFYVDGAQSSSLATTATTGGNGPISFGGDYDSNVPSNFYPGGLDELRIYSRALAASEVVALASQ